MLRLIFRFLSKKKTNCSALFFYAFFGRSRGSGSWRPSSDCVFSLAGLGALPGPPEAPTSEVCVEFASLADLPKGPRPRKAHDAV